MKKMLAFVAAVLLSALPLAADGNTWTGYITDPHCGKKGASPEHTADCVEKCIKDGSKSQIQAESDGKAYNLDDFEKVRAYVGQKVTIRGTLDAKSNTIAVASVTKAE
jgi:uncharacterized protein DUF5818